jgi:hypothetical protein
MNALCVRLPTCKHLVDSHLDFLLRPLRVLASLRHVVALRFTSPNKVTRGSGVVSSNSASSIAWISRFFGYVGAKDAKQELEGRSNKHAGLRVSGDASTSCSLA